MADKDMKELKLKDYRTKADIKYTDFMLMADLVKGDIKDDLPSNDFIVNQTLRIFYGLTLKEVRELQMDQIDLLVNKINSVLSLPVSGWNKIIKMGGKEYGFIPDFTKITSGELIDMDSCLTDRNYVGLTSIVYRPIVKKNKMGEYLIEPYQGYDERFKDVSMDIVEGYIDFFVKSFQTLSQITHLSTIPA